MLQLPTGHDALNVDGCSLDELGERIGRAIARLLAVLGEPVEAEQYLRGWIAGLDATTRRRFIARVLAEGWPAGSDASVAAAAEGLAAQRSRAGRAAARLERARGCG